MLLVRFGHRASAGHCAGTTSGLPVPAARQDVPPPAASLEQAVRARHSAGHSQRAIARELGVDRRKVKQIIDRDHARVDTTLNSPRLGRQPVAVSVFVWIPMPCLPLPICGPRTPNVLTRRRPPVNESADRTGKVYRNWPVNPGLDTDACGTLFT